LFEKGSKANQDNARGELIDIVSDAGDVGFEMLVRALARNDQDPLARQLDKELAEKFMKKLSIVASMSSLSLLLLASSPSCFIKVKLKVRGFIYSALDDKYLVLKALRHGSHSLTCKQHVRVHQMAPPRTVVTTPSCSLLLIYRPRKDERLSWLSWLTYS